MKRRDKTAVLEDRITCPNCGYESQSNALVCKRCGRLLTRVGSNSGQPAASARPLPPEAALAPPEGVVVVHVRDSDTPINCRLGDEMVIGRYDPDDGAFPDLDLSLYDALEKGVSRRHAAVRRAGGFLHLVDLNSANCTYLNGQRLTPLQPSVLHDGDEVRLGRLVLRIYFRQQA